MAPKQNFMLTTIGQEPFPTALVKSFEGSHEPEASVQRPAVPIALMQGMPLQEHHADFGLAVGTCEGAA